ncbi:MAG: hypothetical protein RLN89_06465 [Parvibaculum sp.]
MASARQIATKHIEAALAEAAAERLPAESIARIMFEKALHIYKETRSIEDIAAELNSAAENLDPDTDYMFMRP